MASPAAEPQGKARRPAETPAPAREASSNEIRERLQKIEQLQQGGKLDEAVAELIAVGAMYSARSAPVKAVAVLRQAARMRPENADVRMAYGEVLHRLRMVEDAVREYGTACGLLEAAGRYSEWLEVLRRLLAMDSDNLAGRLQLAEALSRAGKTAEAIQAFRSLGEILLERGETEDWERVAERLLHHDAMDTTVAHDLALHYGRSGRHAEALAKLVLCHEAVPNDPELLDLIIDTLEALGQRVKAAVICRELVRTFRRNGLEQEAKHSLERLYSLDPDDDEARQAMGVLHGEVAADTVIELEAGSTRRTTSSGQTARRAADLDELPTGRVVEPKKTRDSTAQPPQQRPAPPPRPESAPRPEFAPRPESAPRPAATPSVAPRSATTPSQAPRPATTPSVQPRQARPVSGATPPVKRHSPSSEPFQAEHTPTSESAWPRPAVAPAGAARDTVPAVAARPGPGARPAAPAPPPDWDSPTILGAHGPRGQNPARPPAPVPALDALSSLDDEAELPELGDDDEEGFDVEERTMVQDSEHSIMDLGHESMPLVLVGLPGQAPPPEVRLPHGPPRSSPSPDALADASVPVASTRRRSNSLPRPHLARRMGTVTELPTTLRDMSKDLATLEFFIERGFYESAVALLDALQKRHPDSLELQGYRVRIERMHRG